MNRPSFDFLASYRTNQGQSLLFGHLMVVLMMVCVGIGCAQFGARLVPGWQGFYVVMVTLLVSIEAIATRQRVQNMEFRDRVIFHVSEWVAFAVAIKLLLYLLHGPAQLLNDLPLWQENFVQNFFTGEYMAALVVALLVWLSAAAYSGEMADLYSRERDAIWDDLGKLQNVLHEIRGRIAARIFVIGGFVVLLAIFSRVETAQVLKGQPSSLPDYNGPVINVLVYFVLALLLLSQTQFALLRTRWMWQKLPISPDIARHWFQYGLIFLLVLGVIVFILPNHYTIGLFDTLRMVLVYLFQALSFLLVLLAFPFTLCLSLFNLTSGPAQSTPPQPLAPPQAFATAQPIAWLEFLKSLAFWVIFLAVVFFALRYYLTQNAALWNAIRGFPLFRWVSGTWGALWKWLRGANRQIAGMVQSGIKRLRQQRPAISTRAVRRIFNLGRMSPREKVIYFYLNLVHLGGERGLERRPGQTPYKYEERLSSAIPEIDPELRSLTETFLEARYSQHPVDEPKSEQANSLWERIKAILRGWKPEG